MGAVGNKTVAKREAARAAERAAGRGVGACVGAWVPGCGAGRGLRARVTWTCKKLVRLFFCWRLSLRVAVGVDPENLYEG